MKTRITKQHELMSEERFDDIKNKLRHLLIDGVILYFDDSTQVRWLDAGQTYEAGDYIYKAMESGVFILWPGNDEHHWMYHGSFKMYESALFDGILESAEKAYELEGWFTGVLASKVLTDMRRERKI